MILPNSGCLVAGVFSQEITINSRSGDVNLSTVNDSLFVCEFSCNGNLLVAKNLPVSREAELSHLLVSANNEKIFALNERDNLMNQVNFFSLDDNLSSDQLFSLSTDKELELHDILIIDQCLFICGGYEGTLLLNGHLLLKQMRSLVLLLVIT